MPERHRNAPPEESLYEPIEWTASEPDYDDYGRLVAVDTDNSNNTSTHRTYDCCHLLTEVDENAITTTYADYNVLWQPRTVIKEGVDENGAYLEQALKQGLARLRR